jgi:pimeloyl-ACP methyl ester carboxylesterase
MDPHLPARRSVERAPAGPSLGHRARVAATRALLRLAHPGDRAVVAGSAATPLPRVRYHADDGWRADLFKLARPGAHGAPVLLAHGLGGGHRDFCLDADHALGSFLAARGYAVYALETRGDPSAAAPAAARPFTLDDLATRDLPAAMDAVRADSGFHEVALLGHGLGAQLFALALALDAIEEPRALVAIGGAVRFAVPRSAARAAGIVAGILPPTWSLPSRSLAQLALPFVRDGAALGSPGTSGPVARGRLRHGTGDLHAGVVAQLLRSIAEGALTDATGRLDVLAAVATHGVPSLVVEPGSDPACPRGAAAPLARALGGRLLELDGAWGHLDPLLGERARRELFPVLAAFLDEHRALD